MQVCGWVHAWSATTHLLASSALGLLPAELDLAKLSLANRGAEDVVTQPRHPLALVWVVAAAAATVWLLGLLLRLRRRLLMMHRHAVGLIGIHVCRHDACLRIAGGDAVVAIGVTVDCAIQCLGGLARRRLGGRLSLLRRRRVSAHGHAARVWVAMPAAGALLVCILSSRDVRVTTAAVLVAAVGGAAAVGVRARRVSLATPAAGRCAILGRRPRRCGGRHTFPVGARRSGNWLCGACKGLLLWWWLGLEILLVVVLLLLLLRVRVLVVMVSVCRRGRGAAAAGAVRAASAGWSPRIG
jgi:hypothetical protein